MFALTRGKTESSVFCFFLNQFLWNCCIIFDKNLYDYISNTSKKKIAMNNIMGHSYTYIFSFKKNENELIGLNSRSGYSKQHS